jgi:hypothetical protein
MGRALTESQWSLLGQRRPTEEGSYAANDTGLLCSGEPILYALDWNDCRHLLVPAARVRTVREDRRSAGVQIRSHRLSGEAEERLFVDIVCLKPHLNVVFGFFIDDVLEALGVCCEDPVTLCRQALDRWRELLRGDDRRMMDSNALQGLLGELICLRNLAAIADDCLDIWTGPEGHRHDFCRSGISMEVKTTSVRQGRVFAVSGQNQLEALDKGKLYLAAIKLEHVPKASLSVPGLVERLLAMGLDEDVFHRKLRACGYDHADRDVYENRTYALTEYRMYEVVPGFPRIVPGSFCGGAVPQGITGLTYQIDLSTEPPYPLPEDRTDQVLHWLLAGCP